MGPGQTLSELTGRALLKLEGALGEYRPDLVLAQGDTTTVMAAAMTCFYLGVPFGHVEAGLRTGNLRSPFPEEFNRVVAGKTATFHFAPTRSAADALRAEGVDGAAIFLTGNTVIDALADAARRVEPGNFAAGEGRRLILLTTHRREYFGDAIRGVLRTLRRIVDDRPEVEILFPAHLNPEVQAATREEFLGHPRIRVVEPLGYLDFVAAMRAADLIVTDSGGVQEEAPYLRKPVLVTRNETERPDAVDCGLARLVGTDPGEIARSVDALLDDAALRASMTRGVSPYGDGRAAERIVGALAHAFGLAPEAPAMFDIGSSDAHA
jgi:UDP-N-acetylglucosamine 2-epimerase (non-hydrolysing)